MNKEFLNIHENLPSERIMSSSFLTYFEDKHGFIYYSSGVGTHPSDSLVRAVLVYAPAEESNSTRIQVDTGRFFTKVVDNGGLVRFNKEDVGEGIAEIIKTRYTRDPITDEPILAVKSSDVIKVYDPRISLGIILGDSRGLYGEAQQSLFKLKELFLQQKVNESEIGIYGGLQVGILNRNNNAQVNLRDIDVVVYGLRNLPVVKNLVQKSRKIDFQLISHELAYHERAVMRRDYYAKLGLGAIGVDIKIIRQEWDKNSYPPDWKFSGVSITNRGEMIDDIEVLTIPASFKIKTTDGQLLTVSTRMFNYIGAGWAGDEVAFFGDLGVDGSVLLRDPSKHFIYPML
jgi:predicted nucleotidyltransferase